MQSAATSLRFPLALSDQTRHTVPRDEGIHFGSGIGNPAATADGAVAETLGAVVSSAPCGMGDAGMCASRDRTLCRQHPSSAASVGEFRHGGNSARRVHRGQRPARHGPHLGRPGPHAVSRTSAVGNWRRLEKHRGMAARRTRAGPQRRHFLHAAAAPVDRRPHRVRSAGDARVALPRRGAAHRGGRHRHPLHRHSRPAGPGRGHACVQRRVLRHPGAARPAAGRGKSLGHSRLLGVGPSRAPRHLYPRRRRLARPRRPRCLSARASRTRPRPGLASRCHHRAGRLRRTLGGRSRRAGAGRRQGA